MLRTTQVQEAHAARRARLVPTVITAYEGGRAWAAGLFRQQALTLWSHAQAVNCAVLRLVQAPLRLARRPGPHGRNIVLMNLTTGFSARAQESRRTGPVSPTATASVTAIASRHPVSSG